MSGAGTTRRSGAILAAACLLALPGAGVPQDETRSYDLQAGAVIRVSNPTGNIRISGWDQSRAEVRAVRRARAVSGPAPLDVRAGALSLEVRPVWDPRAGEVVDFELKVPAGVHVEQAVSASGDVEVTGVGGRVSATSSSGRVRVAETGPATVRSASGSITVTSAAEADIQTVSGAITVEKIRGPLRATTSSSRITVVEVGGPAQLSASSGGISVVRAAGPVVARSISGPVEVSGGSGSVTASSTSSGVRITGTRGRVEVRSTSGELWIDDAAAEGLDARSTSGSVYYRGSLASGGRYELETLSGGVTLVLPAVNCGFDLVAKTVSGVIETDFDITAARTEVKGNTRRLEGVHGAGCARVRATSFSGNVRLRRDANLR
jgi:DUF4097 and DUF4098 domain-containing protein YvlB